MNRLDKQKYLPFVLELVFFQEDMIATSPSDGQITDGNSGDIFPDIPNN